MLFLTYLELQCCCFTYSACLKSSPGAYLCKATGFCLIYAHKYAHASFSCPRFFFRASCWDRWTQIWLTSLFHLDQASCVLMGTTTTDCQWILYHSCFKIACCSKVKCERTCLLYFYFVIYSGLGQCVCVCEENVAHKARLLVPNVL